MPFAFQIGLHPAEYWEMTFGEFADCIEGYNQRQRNEAQVHDALNHTLGNYMRIAFHDPKHYPKKPFSNDNSDNKEVANTDEQRIRLARLKYGKKE